MQIVWLFSTLIYIVERKDNDEQNLFLVYQVFKVTTMYNSRLAVDV